MADKKSISMFLDCGQTVILDIGGVKYETYYTTLTAYPDTRLVSFFLNVQNDTLTGAENPEFFFKRNGKAFHYIMEFYRTGKILWSPNAICDNEVIDLKELQRELLYFQIPFIDSPKLNSHIKLGTVLGKFFRVLEREIIRGMSQYKDLLQFQLYEFKGPEKNICGQFEPLIVDIDSNILYNLATRFQSKIREHLESIFEYSSCEFSQDIGVCIFLFFPDYDANLIKRLARLQPLSQEIQKKAQGLEVISNSLKDEEQIIFNVGGEKHAISRSILAKYPKTLLGKEFSKTKCGSLMNNRFFDRNSHAFHYIKEYFFTGKITWSPSSIMVGNSVTFEELKEELAFFEIPSEIEYPQLIAAHLQIAISMASFILAIETAIKCGIKNFRKEVLINIFEMATPDETSTGITKILKIELDPSIIWNLSLKHPTIICKHLELSLPGVKCEFNEEIGFGCFVINLR
ncbi:hypothetical protein G9A89_000154 [Geosiphon pyriformis]|nr:hypothetical protein G9A89_000154 [Geosiphon pyriformis]